MILLLYGSLWRTRSVNPLQVGRLKKENLWSKGKVVFPLYARLTQEDECLICNTEYLTPRQGEYTRGMCVVDRRNNKKAGHGSKFGKSMAELRDEEEQKQQQISSQQEPAPVQVDKPSQASLSSEEKGINVVIQTPGSEALVEKMLKDIWGA